MENNVYEIIKKNKAGAIVSIVGNSLTCLFLFISTINSNRLIVFYSINAVVFTPVVLNVKTTATHQR